MSLSSIVRSIALAREFFSATLETEARVWVHILKTVGAALIAMGLSMRLELSSPRTAMVTVFIVMQPQTGMVIAKSFYRFIGTIVGATVTVGLTALFGQFFELFLLSITLWICLCTIGASLNRSFRAYGFVLSGYTTALIGIPALANPDGVFISAMTRLSELSMGIFCAATVSALIFPQHVADTLREVVRTRFIRFSKLVGDAVGAQAVHGAPTELHALFSADVVGLEALSSVAVFEDFETKWRARRLSQLNTEFMNVTTRVRALHQWLLRLRATEEGAVVDLIENCLQEIPSLLVTAEGQPVRNAAEAKDAAEQLLAFNAALPSRLANTRSAIEESSLTMLPDFDTSAELLERLVDEMHRYTEAYASLAEDAYDGPAATARFATKTNLLAASASGLRAAAALCLSAMIWYVTAWPSGAGAVVNTAVNSALTGTMPNPAVASRQMLWGTVTACVLAPAVLFFVYPLIDGYALLCAVLIPPLALGVYISTRPGGMGFGLGYCISFCLLAGPDNPMVYDVERTLNDALGLVISMVIVLLASTIIFPSARPWLRNMLLRDLLRQASLACSTKLSLARLYLESHTRDLGHQLNVASAGELKAQASAAAWMFTILDFGHSIVELRVELQKLSDLRDDTRVSVQRLLDCIFSMFETPSADQVIVVRRGSRDAILALRAEFDARADCIQVRELRRLSAYLHFIDFKLGQLPSTSVVDRKEWLRRFLAWDADGVAS